MPKVRNVIGHLLQQEQLQNDMEFNNVSHAYLFCGPAHVGKHTLALQFACNLLATDVPEEQKSDVKAAVEKLTHPDLLVLDSLWMADSNEDWDTIAKHSNVPQVHRKKNKAKTDVIGIDDIRALQERLHETGTGTYRCCIITSVERMQNEAANAFLKMLEEPPEGLVFILTSEAQSSLLPTIISRSRILSFRRVPALEMRSLLEGVPEDEQTFILHIASGAPGMVIRLRDDPDLLRMHRTIHGTAQSFWRSKSASERMSMLNPIHKRGDDADTFVFHLGLALREQGTTLKPAHVRAFQGLLTDLKTNTHRQLLTHRFALEVTTE